jgi:hypothetical protein
LTPDGWSCRPETSYRALRLDAAGLVKGEWSAVSGGRYLLTRQVVTPSDQRSEHQEFAVVVNTVLPAPTRAKPRPDRGLPAFRAQCWHEWWAGMRGASA